MTDHDLTDGRDDGAAALDELRAFGRSRLPQPLPSEHDDVAWEAPPADLWSRIEAANASDAVAPSDAARPGDDPTGVVAPIDVARRRKGAALRRWEVLVAAAVFAALVIGVAVIGLTAPRATSVASVDLDLLGDAGSGSAELVEVKGSMQLRLKTADLDAGDGYFEVWAIDPDVSGMVSLGPLRPDGVYDLPDNLDMANYPIVDISIESTDGDPTHSGNSILRGTLEL